MNFKYLILLSGLLVLVGGCNSFPSQKVTKSEKKYVEPVKYTQSTPVEIPEPPVLEPREKGQMIAVEKFEPFKPKSSYAALKEARDSSTEGVNEMRFINAITFYDYQPGKIYEILCTPGRVTDIIFNENEVFNPGDVVLGYTEGFHKSNITTSGTGNNARMHYIVRPRVAGLDTNLIIPTNQRTYYLKIRSYKNSYQTAVRFNYPEEEYKKQLANYNKTIERNSNVIFNVDIINDNFNYKLEGEAIWKPVRVIDNGEKTCITFPQNVISRELPVLYIVSGKQKQLVNCVVKEHIEDKKLTGLSYVVSRLFDEAVLKLGTEEVFIHNNKTGKQKLNKPFKRNEFAR